MFVQYVGYGCIGNKAFINPISYSLQITYILMQF